MERHITFALALAQGLDDTRMIIRHQAAPKEIVVDILTDDDKQTVKYRLVNPHLNHACCTCETATQGKPCYHQIAAVQALYPHTQTATTIRLMLGTRFGFPGGCSRDNWAPLRDALEALSAAPTPKATSTQPARPVPTAGPITAGIRSTQSSLLEWGAMLEQLDAAVRGFPPAQQQRAAEFCTAGLRTVWTQPNSLDLNEVAQLQDFPKPTNFSTKRLASFMEAAKKRPRQPGPSAEVLQEAQALPNLSSSKPSGKLLISQPWAERRGAKEAAEHMQACLSARARPGVRAAATPSVARPASHAGDRLSHLLAEYIKLGPCTASRYAGLLHADCRSHEDVERVVRSVYELAANPVYAILYNTLLALIAPKS